MKKVALFTIALTFIASSSFAAYVQTGGADSNGKLDLTQGSMGVTIDPIGLSPKVEAKYVTDGDSNVTAQWYAIATVHPGGNEAYGTAQNLNNVYKHAYATGAAVSTVLDTIPTTEASESEWTTNTWIQ